MTLAGNYCDMSLKCLRHNDVFRFQRTFWKCQDIPCWKGLSHVSAHPSVTVRTWSVCHFTIRTSKVVHQHADGHARFFIAQILARDQQHNGISGWPDLHPLLSQRVYGVFSRELAHCLPTNRCNAASSKPPKDRLIVALRWVLHFLLAQLFNWKLPWLTLPFLPMPLPHVMKQQWPLSRPSRVTALPSKKESGPLLTWFGSSPISCFPNIWPCHSSPHPSQKELIARQQSCHQKRIRAIAHSVCEFSHLVVLFSTI